jgi:hypothetical protein
LLNVIPAVRWAENVRLKQSKSSTTLTVFDNAVNAASARQLYSSPEKHNPIDARRNLYRPYPLLVFKATYDGDSRLHRVSLTIQGKLFFIS